MCTLDHITHDTITFKGVNEEDEGIVESWWRGGLSPIYCWALIRGDPASNSISHLHVKGPVKTKSNAAKKWNGVSFIIIWLSTDTKYSGRLCTKPFKSTILWPPVRSGAMLKVQISRMMPCIYSILEGYMKLLVSNFHPSFFSSFNYYHLALKTHHAIQVKGLWILQWGCNYFGR